MEQLHPGARWNFRFRGYIGGIFFMMFLGWFIFPVISVIFSISGASESSILGVFFISAFFYIILVILIGEIYARMSYNRWFYEFTETNLKLERGIIWKRYSNVPYERVQNVDIHRGIIARIFGFSTVLIQTAGFSYAGRGGMGVEGYIPAVEPQKAEKIRDFVMKKISKRSNSGL